MSSIQRNNWTLTSRRSVELLLRDWQGIINTQVSDTTPRIFKKEVDFVPFYNCVSVSCLFWTTDLQTISNYKTSFYGREGRRRGQVVLLQLKDYGHPLHSLGRSIVLY